MTPAPEEILYHVDSNPWNEKARERTEEIKRTQKEQFKKDDEELFGCESRYSALLAIAKELQFCADNMGLAAGSEDPEIVARARAASVRLNQLESFEL